MKRFALTFDDGPGPSTPALLDVLARAGVKATFFLLGKNVERWPDIAGRVAREGHVIGNHSYSHLRPAAWREFGADVLRGQEVVARLRPPGPVPFRLPYGIQLVDGALDPRVAVIASLGLGHQHWTSDFEDWTLRDGDGAALAARMIAHVESWPMEAVLDLHDSGTGSSFGYERPATVEGVRLLLEEAGRRGWGTFTVPRG